MIVVDTVLGNRHEDPRLADRYAAARDEGRLETLTLPPLLAGRRRLKAASDAGTEIGITLSEGRRLRDGDVLVNEEGGRLVVVALPAPQTVRLRCDPALPSAAAFEAGLRLGHLLGMQHWDYQSTNDVCVVPVTDRAVVEAVLRAHPVAGVGYEFQPSGAEAEGAG